ncbi:MAG TPA: head-tail connector protein [Sedimentibacter sp.]|nr:head-tail connector protein [Sedimentibacter sp.]
MMLTEIKTYLRISNTACDDEINDLIDAAKSDLKLSGVNINKTITETITPEPTEENPNPEPVEIQVMDSLIKRAIIIYVKANFGWNNPDAERLQQSYNMLKSHLALSQEYAEVTEDAV